MKVKDLKELLNNYKELSNNYIDISDYKVMCFHHTAGTRTTKSVVGFFIDHQENCLILDYNPEECEKGD